ncbi:peptidoglycan binding domain-containing protein [Patescibacteria group bacterium]|nr:peptidoglycan binding domain-containing protein [Patescibacteria group bacterium]
MKKKVQTPNSEKNLFWQNLITWLVGSLIAFLVLIFACYHFAYWHKIYPGVKVLGQSVGHQTVAQATQTLEKFIAAIQPRLELTNEQQKWDLDLDKLEFNYQPQATAQKAYQIGREGKNLKDFQNKIKAWLKGINLNPEYTFNQNLFDEQVATIAAQIYIPAIEPMIEVAQATTPGQTSRIIIEQGKNGQELDKRELLS